MLSTLANALKVKELRGKLLFTLMIFCVFRLGCHIPAPGIDPTQIDALFTQQIFGFIDIISGGAFKNISLFAMGIMPYINASIIMQLLTMVIPAFSRWSKEGEEGKKKIGFATRIAAVILAVIQAIGIVLT